MVTTTYNFLILILIFAGVIVLQVFLSKMESKWSGLILPFIFIGISVICVLNMAVLPGQEGFQITVMVTEAFLLFNIPTYILLAIYFAFRAEHRRKRKKDIEKMNIQDLK